MAAKIVPDELDVQLSKTITMGEETFDVIHLKEPNLGQLSQFFRKIRAGEELDAFKWLISAVSGIPLPVIEKIGARDFWKAEKYLEAFITSPDESDPSGNVGGSL